MKRTALLSCCFLGLLALTACGTSSTAWLLRDSSSSEHTRREGAQGSSHSWVAHSGAWSSHSFSRPAPNYAAIAKRFGMTEAQVAAEVKKGKTLMQIGIEHGVKFAAPHSVSSRAR